MVTDFADQENWKQIPMPGGETVVDAFLRDGVIYTLAYAQNRNPSNHNVESYRTVVYKSTTGKEGSFQEVLSFDYATTPICFANFTSYIVGRGLGPAAQETRNFGGNKLPPYESSTKKTDPQAGYHKTLFGFAPVFFPVTAE